VLSRKLEVLLHTLAKLLRKRAYQRIQYIIQKIHFADLAVVFRFLDEEDQHTLFDLIKSPEKRAELLENLDYVIAANLVADYNAEQIAEIVSQMSDDDAADLIQELEQEKVDAVLALLHKDDSEDLKDLIKFDEDTAGGIMTTDFVAVPSSFTARQALDVVQETGEEAEMVFYVYAVDAEGRLEGVVSLRELLQADESQRLEESMTTDIYKVRTDLDQEEVARMIARYDLLAVPVVDPENHLVGIITVDDIIDVIREEATEDILKLVGAGEELLEDYSVRKSILSRLPWLLATWFGGIMVMKLVGHYEDKLSHVVALAAFFPVILGMAGNLGQQSATIVVRGIAIGRINVQQLAATVSKEALTGLAIGAVYGLLIAAVAWYEFGDKVALIPIVVGVAQAINMFLAAVIGSFIPLFLSRLKVDPAIATGPLVATSLDFMGMFILMQISMIFIF